MELGSQKRSSRQRVGIAHVMLLIAACTARTSDGSELSDVDRAAEVLAGAMCEAFYACDCQARIQSGDYGSESDCVAYHRSQLRSALAAVQHAGGDVDVDCAEATADNLRSCHPDPPIVCDIAAGAGIAGEQCSGFVLTQSGRASSCVSELSCISGVCSDYEAVSLGESCSEPTQVCMDAFSFCSRETGRCEMGGRGAGQPCSDSAECDTGLYCRGGSTGTGACADRLEPGAACDAVDERACRLECDDAGCEEYVCSAGECLPRGPQYCQADVLVL